MKEIDTWTLDQCRDYIAEAMGYKRYLTASWYKGEWTEGTMPPHFTTHPVGNTLDAIAGSLPEGYTTRSVMHLADRAEQERWWAECHIPATPMEERVSRRCPGAYGDTELLARARACCKAWHSTPGAAPWRPWKEGV